MGGWRGEDVVKREYGAHIYVHEGDSEGGLIRIQDQEEGCWRLKSWSVVSWISCSSAWTFADEDDDDKEIGSRLRMEFVFVVCLVAVVDDFELKDLLSLILPSKSIFTEKRAQTGL